MSPQAPRLPQIPGGELQKVSEDLSPVRHHSARTKARKRALDVLFEAEQRGADPVEVLDQHSVRADPLVRPFTIELVRGVTDHLDAIDERIRTAASKGWPIDRMAAVDRALARIATYEIDHTDIVPDAAIAEAVELADELSTDESADFLSGLLGQIARTKG